MNKKRILVIDDECSITRLLKLNLEAGGEFEVREENRGARGLTTAREFKPDLIVLDLAMPDLDGREVARELRADPELQHVPIVVLTAVETPERVTRHSTALENAPRLDKPLSVQSIRAAIEQAMAA